MSIRPIDMQIVVPRSTEVNKAGHENNPRPDLQSQNFSREFQRKVDTEQRQVNELFRADDQKVDADGRRKREQEKKKKEKEKEKGAVPRKFEQSESRFDISV